MPTWDTICECGARDSVTSRYADRAAMMPKHCGKPMEVDFSTYRQVVEVFDAYTTTNIHPEGKPLYVRNTGDLKRLETEYGVKRIDDPGLVARGGEFVRDTGKKRTYI